MKKMEKKIQIKFDGASKNNPGESGAGWHIKAPEIDYEVKGYEYLGPKKTNNQAEYNGLLRGLEAMKNALRQVVKDIENIEKYSVLVQGDSQLAIKQLNKEFKVKSDNIRELYHEVIKLVEKIPNIKFEWIPRNQNKTADALANRAVETRQTNFNVQ